MPLKIKHKTIPNNSNRNIVLTETTGVYSATNLTGYGTAQTPTGTREIPDIFLSELFVLTANGTVVYTGSRTPTIEGLIYAFALDTPGGGALNSVTAQSIANGNPATYDLNTLAGYAYVDGVYKTIYDVMFSDAVPVTCSCTGNTILTVSDTAPFLGANKIRFSVSGTIYEYNIVSVNTGSLTLSANGPILVSSLIGFGISYTSTAYFANTFSINKCLHSRISKLAISSCSCDNKCTQKLYEAVMLYMAIQPNVDLGKYQKAQDIIEYLTHYCNDGCCNC
jgi:hypothetical protein